MLVVTPYVEGKFFRRLVRDLAPGMLTVVIDDGCRPEDIRMIQALRSKGQQIQVALGGATGLMHAKVFHVEWETPGGRSAHSLVYGSGNATRQAFEGDINAELMCRARLTAVHHRPILQWTRAVRDAVASIADGDARVEGVRDVALADGIVVRLPTIVVKDATTKAGNFDLWLQRGRLAAAFRPDPSFLRVHINLHSDLPPGTLEQTVLDLGFETQRTRRLGIPYLRTGGLLDGGTEGHGHWRSRYFALTHLGDWCSAACHAERKHQFRKAGHVGRARTLALLNGLKDPSRRNRTRARYLDRIEGLWTALGPDAKTYLSSNGGRVDLERYGRLFEQRVDYDLTRAADEEFRTRFIDGVEIIDVPRFRVDTRAWNAFVESFARQLRMEDMKRRSVSLIYRRVSAALGVRLTDPFENPLHAVKLLRKHWNHEIQDDDGEPTTVGAYIDGYHYAGADDLGDGPSSSRPS
ncbi:hypothetical protein AIGOOFII_4305 [Methylobacterium marchantiae]|nr:hypothetical protein AIGOOFII_4305 [Methylobacterium marchantiae]